MTITTIADDVTYEVADSVARISFARPPHNHFNLALIRSLGQAFTMADDDPAVRALAFMSEGKVFCAGADFGGGLDSDPVELYREAIKLFGNRKPVVAAVQGAAIGGGFGLAMVGDFRIVAPEARFAANFVKLGIHPGFGLSYVLPRVIGLQAASMLFYTGRRINGTEALRIGLADELVSLGELRDRTLALAAEIAENAPLALESTRATLRAGLADAIAAHCEIEAARQRELFKTRDFHEGVRAVAERRPGNWVRG